jgi:hypothetical protein
MTEAEVMTLEQALSEGVRGWQIRNTARWHKHSANHANGRDKERHFKLAADLNRLAAKLEESGRP